MVSPDANLHAKSLDNLARLAEFSIMAVKEKKVPTKGYTPVGAGVQFGGSGQGQKKVLISKKEADHFDKLFANAEKNSENAEDLKLIREIEKSGPEVKSLCERYGLKREELARLTGFSVRAIADWAAHGLQKRMAERRIREIDRLLLALAEIVDPAEIPDWLHKSNKAFDGMTPLQVIEIGEIDRLWHMIHEIGSGYLD
jgi:DNA-binding transcriptional regulator YiaG